MTKDSLAPSFDKCGIARHHTQADPRKAALRKVAGRTREDLKPKFDYTEELKNKAWEIAKPLLAEKKSSRRNIFNKVCKVLWSYIDNDGKVALLPKPSPRQFYYELDKRHGRVAELKRQSGPGEFRNDFRGKLGNVLMEAIGVGHQYEMDSTQVDLWIVSKDDRSKIIGKPTLYLIVDRYSRLIVGYHLTLDKPSWDGAKRAILSLVEDREAKANRLEVPWKPELHPAHGHLPGQIILDRGSENIGYDSDRIADDVEVDVINLPAHFSSGKGTIECSFRITHVPLRDNTAGYQFPAEAMRRHGDSYMHDAEFDLDDLDAELYQIFEMHNQKMYPGMPLAEEAKLAGVRPIPLQVWKHDQSKAMGLTTKYDAKSLEAKLLSKKLGVISQNGIRLNDVFYTCDHAEKNNWFVKKAGGRYPEVNISYDRRHVDTIFVQDLVDPRRWHEAHLTPACVVYAGKSFAEVSVSVSSTRQAEKEADDHNLVQQLQHEHDRAPRAAKAHQKTQADIAASNGASRTSGAKDVRAKEATGRRAAQAAVAARVKPSSMAQSEMPPSDVAAPVLKVDAARAPSRPLKVAIPTRAFDPMAALMEMDDD
ncbi:hypothetical protein SAMN05444746_11614 [Variovorax sp. OK212]|nr:hypothetical protein SAMN05518853_11614 [Variovorax sp. OK202]SFE06369.1 hypothetical protein SAMN05444746_11614 [Variovorax sp. OK212]